MSSSKTQFLPTLPPLPSPLHSSPLGSKCILWVHFPWHFLLVYPLPHITNSSRPEEVCHLSFSLLLVHGTKSTHNKQSVNDRSVSLENPGLRLLAMHLVLAIDGRNIVPGEVSHNGKFPQMLLYTIILNSRTIKISVNSVVYENVKSYST